MACWPSLTWWTGSGHGGMAAGRKGDYAVHVKQITPLISARQTVLMAAVAVVSLEMLGKLAKRGRACVSWLLMSGKIVLTLIGAGRRYGQTARRNGSQGSRAGRRALPEPAPGAGDRPGVPGQRVLRRPGRGAGQVRDGAEGPGRGRLRHPGSGGVRVLPAVVLRRGRRAGGLRA